MGNVKEMQALTTESGQVYVHEPCADYFTPVAWVFVQEDGLGPEPSTLPADAPKCECNRPGPWLKVYVEKESK